MWVRMAFAKVDPKDLDAVRAFSRSDAIAGVLRTQPGYHFHYLLESVEHPGEIRSITAWGSRADAEAYERSGVYAELVRQFGQWLTMPPQVNSYEVRE
jgi:heme-degrading monooxygenase HmoA